jgi:NDP-sugar pyrophosphorylase family protein
MQVAILAGGLGTRLGDLTRNQPKAILKIHGKPFIEYQLELFSHGGIRDVVLCLGHLGKQIESYLGNGGKYGLNIRYSFEDKLLGTGGALKNAAGLLDGIFFTMYGDAYLSLDFGRIMSYFKSRDKLALMTVFRNCDRYDSSNTAIQDSLVRKYSKQEKTEEMEYIDYGAHLFRKEALEMIPANRHYSLEEFFTSLIADEQLLAYEVRERFYEIGSPQGLKEFKEYIRGG